VLDAEAIDDGEIIRQPEQGVLRPKRSIGRKPKRALSALAKERIAAIIARAEAGQRITEVDRSPA
jgi:hypothetical protein